LDRLGDGAGRDCGLPARGAAAMLLTCSPEEHDPDSGRPVPHCDGTGLGRALCL